MSTLSDEQMSAATALAESVYTWLDIADRLTCSEAEIVAEFLRAFGRDGLAADFLEAHGYGDDDPEDMHYRGDA